jgi:ABC-type transport system involved in multi-copper enzyme maturation permease subunit
LGDFLKLNGQDVTYANYFWYQGYTVMVILALAGALLIGNDIRHGSLPFYLSKPIGRWHYLAGKCLAIGVLINLMTTLPAAILYFEYGLLESWSYFETNPRLFVGILGYGIVLTVSLSLLLIATAILLRRTVPMIMAWATLFVFCRVLAGILVDSMRYDARWRLIDLWNDTYVLGSACLGIPGSRIRPAPQPTWQEAFLVLGAVCLLCLTYLIRRIQAVEIVH